MDNFVDFACPNGESFKNQINRVEQFFIQQKKTWTNSKIALIAHAGTIRSFQCILNGINPINAFDTEIKYGEITKIIA